MNMNSQYKNISGCKYRLKQIRTAILLGFLLCGPTAMAQNVKEDMPAGGHEKYRKYVLLLPTDGRDTMSLYDAARLPFVYKVNAVTVTPSGELVDLVRYVDRLVQDKQAGLQYVRIGVSSSPDGVTAKNCALADRRVEALASYLREIVSFPPGVLRIENLGEDWSSVERYLRANNFPHKERILKIISSVANEDSRKAAIRSIDGGQTWHRMITEIFPALRGARMLIVCDAPTPAPEQKSEETTVMPESEPKAETSVVEVPTKPQPKPVVEITEPVVKPQPESRYRWAVKTNVAYLAATVANLGVEYSFGDHYSVDLPIIYSPYTVARDYRLRFLVIQPEFRYWLKTPMVGHFWGAHLNIGSFNISVNDKNRYQSPDGFYGAGLSYGYALPLIRHWAAEFTLGAGYIYTKYDTYYNIPNGARFEKGMSYNYWGLTKVGVNLVYRFGK